MNFDSKGKSAKTIQGVFKINIQTLEITFWIPRIISIPNAMLKFFNSIHFSIHTTLPQKKSQGVKSGERAGQVYVENDFITF